HATNTLRRSEPAEKLRAERTADGDFRLWITVNYLRPGISRPTVIRKKITKEDWDDLIETVFGHNLMEWAPDVAGAGADPSEALRLKLGSLTENSQLWFGALENGEGPDELTRKMLRLSRKTAPYLPLAY